MNAGDRLSGLLLAVLLGGAAHGAAPRIAAHLPGATVNAAVVDTAGNIYVAGYRGATFDAEDAFVAKFGPDGSTLYTVSLAGSKYDAASNIAVDASGAAYVVGGTQSPDFPVTPGALQTAFASDSTAGFAVKLDAAGKVVYATFLGGTSTASPGQGGLLVDGAGELLISGQTVGSDFPTAPAPPFSSTAMNTNFLLKLDASGEKILAAIRGIGGALTADGQGNVYVAGAVYGGQPIPLTDGAFQTSYVLHGCGGTGQVGFACSYQYVAKLDAGLTRVLYSTYVTGSWGARPVAISVDAAGNATVVGTTNSPDYPTTPEAFQPVYAANAPPPPATCLFGCIFPPPSSGYVTKVNATGTGLVYSTFFSGSQQDSIGFAAFGADGIYLSGQAGSDDLPGFAGMPFQCLPRNYVTRFSLDGESVTAARTVSGAVLALDASTGTLMAWTGEDLVGVDPAAAPNPVACVLDAADLKPVTAVAPGELLSVFGIRLAESTAAPGAEAFPTNVGGVTVDFGGTAAPLLYVSPKQVNVQVPFEVAGQESVTMTWRSGDVSAGQTLGVAARNPVAFLDTVTPRNTASFPICQLNGLWYSGGALPLAFNSDGSRNSCAHPAAPGSKVRIFLAGLGVTEPALVTGAVTPQPGIPLNLPITTGSDPLPAVASAIAAPGAISGVWQVDVAMRPDQIGAIPLSLTVAGTPVRDGGLTIFVQ